MRKKKNKKNMIMTEDIQECILGFITRHPIFCARIQEGGSTAFDRNLIDQLMECRDGHGHARKGISYYEKIRTALPIRHEPDSVHIQHPHAEIIIHTRPFLGGEVRFMDTACHFPESPKGDDLYVHVMDEYDCPIDLDDASCINRKVSLSWDHNHLMDTCHKSGYFLPRPNHEQMLWEYTVSGPAQVHVEAVMILDHMLPLLSH